MRAALVVGCGIFDDPEIANLQFASRDAARFAEIAEGYFGVSSDNLHVLSEASKSSNHLPTRAGLIRALTTGRRNLRSARTQTLIFYFSGHGFHSREDNEDYLILKDTVLGALADTALSFGTLLRHIRTWNAEHTVLFLDACRSRVEVHKAPLEIDSSPVDVSALCPPGMVTFCSCQPGQKSYEAEECQGGLFTEAVVHSFGPEGRCATVYELDQYLLHKLPELGKLYSKPIQTPYTKVEPLGAQNLVLVRDDIMREWRGRARVGKELRPSRANLEPFPDVSRLLAIDFGAANSVAALYSTQKGTTIVPSPDGEALVPSVVSFRADLSYVVGKRAVSQLRDDPAATVGYVKRLLGSDKASSIYSQSIFPDDVAALIVKSLKTTAEEMSGFSFTTVLASIPINFSRQQEAGLTTALTQAGFSTIRFIPEPCAAALVLADAEFAANADIEELNILVIDMGGGTTDIAAINVGTGSDRATGILLDVVEVDGDPELGGIEYDCVIARFIEEGLAIHKDLAKHFEKATLMFEAERAKRLLNHEASVPVVLSYYDEHASEQREIVVVLKRDELLRGFAEIDDRVVERVQSVIAKTPRYRIDRFDVIMLAGQGTKLFSLRERIKRLFPETPVVDRYQDSAVARGLGVYLRTLSPGTERSAAPLLSNVYGKAVGLRCVSLLPDWPTPSEVRDRTIGQPINSVTVASDSIANVSKVVAIESDFNIPTLKTLKLSFQDGASTMTITPIEIFGSGRENILGHIVIERTTYEIQVVFVSFDVDAEFTTLLRVSLENSAFDPYGSRYDANKALGFQLNNYRLVPRNLKIVEGGVGSLNGLRCIQSDFRRLAS